MQKKPHVSMSVIRRLPRYFRFLRDLDRRGILRVSSRELAEKMGLTASQIRQDFNCFGGYGQQGYGYGVHQLREEIGNILGLNCGHKCILVGAGNLGKALATHMQSSFSGFTLAGVFDSSPAVIGQQIAGLTVLPCAELTSFCRTEKPVMAILCIPRAAVEATVDTLYALGIQSYWNFSSYDIALKYKDAVVETVHLNDSMMTLCCRVSERNAQKTNSEKNF